MNRDDLIQALSQARTLADQITLAAELDALDSANRRTAAAERSLDWSDTVVRQTLMPVRTLDRHTAASDWLADADVSGGENFHQAAVAEASVWFQKLHPAVKADAEEYIEQARGLARRTAGKYGERAEEAEIAFLDYAGFLNRKVLGASGLPQIQQQVDAFENPSPTPLNPEVFDNFAPPVHPINEGIDGTMTNSLAEGAEEAVAGNNGAPSGYPSQHDGGAGPVSQTPNPPRSASLVAEALKPPSVAIGYTRNLDDFLAAEAAQKDGGAAPFGGEPEPFKAEAASGLDQVQQVADSMENPKPTSLPQDVMFPVMQPWPETNTAEVLDKGGESMPQPGARPSTHTSAKAAEAARQVTADMFGGGDSPHAVPGGETPVANSPQTTPQSPNSGGYDQGVSEGRADAAAGEAPTFSDASSAVSDYVRGYSAGYGQGSAPQPPQDVPASMGGDNGQAQNAAEIAARTEQPLTMAKKTGGRIWDTVRNHIDEGAWLNVHLLHDHGVPASDLRGLHHMEYPGFHAKLHPGGGDDEPESWSRRKPHNHKMKRTSSAMLTVDVSQDADFALGYRYATAWTKADDIVALGNKGVEAGIYAGITDNPANQRDWVAEHRKLASEHPELETRLDAHRSVTASFADRNEDALVRGLYVQAGTSLDLDTMSPVTSPSPQGATPFMGPGTKPPLADAQGSPAAPGGPAPYNGAEPMGAPVVDDPLMQPQVPPVSDQPENLGIGGESPLTGMPQSKAFRQKVQANKLALRQQKREN